VIGIARIGYALTAGRWLKSWQNLHLYAQGEGSKRIYAEGEGGHAESKGGVGESPPRVDSSLSVTSFQSHGGTFGPRTKDNSSRHSVNS
jgi:hypothetical protein